MVTTQRVDRVAAEHPTMAAAPFAGSLGSLPTISLTICRSPPGPTFPLGELVHESGWLLACPAVPDEGRREGSLV